MQRLSTFFPLSPRYRPSLFGGLSLSLSLLLPISPLFGGAQAQAQESPQGSPQESSSQSNSVAPVAPVAPTVRFARGEDVGLEAIVAEWRSYYADVPVYLCTCQDSICDQTQQWPYREFDRYQLSVALGPTNGIIAEDSGANCFDIADGSRPTQPRSFSAEQTGTGPSEAIAPPRPPSNNTAPPVAPASRPATVPISPPPISPSPAAPTAVAPPPTQASAPSSSSGVPTTVAAINNGSAIQLTWPSGASDIIAVAGSGWNVTVLNALDCASLSQVEQKTLEAQSVIGNPAIDELTGNVAVPVLLDSCVETDQSAVFILDANEGGGYALYRAQLPGDQSLPNEFSTYALSTIKGLRYWDGSLLVRQGSNAVSAESMIIFRPGSTPAGEYAGCGITRQGEGSAVLCP